MAELTEPIAEVSRHLAGREAGFFIAGAGVGIAAGFAIGYFAMRKRLEMKWEKIADEEIASMRENYRKKLVSLQNQAESRRPLEELVVEKGYVYADSSRYTPEEIEAIEEIAAEEEEEQVRLLAESETVDADDVWDYAIELEKRNDPMVPYIIHFDEFQENDREHEQITVTYYVVDDVLAGVRDERIDDMDETIGLGNLGHWGHGSHDPNVVYVRNEHLCLDFEVIRNPGSYAEESGGNIRHSSNRARRLRQRFDDEP